jgi:hypothetical protein
MKKCSKCKIEKEITFFYKDTSKKDSYQSWCAVCDKKRSKIYRDKGHSSKKRNSKLRKLHPEKEPSYKIKYRYGVTAETYTKMFEKQKGLCEICKKPSPPSKRLGIDHNHITGKVRDLLCMRCNSGIGMFGDNINTTKNAIKYLKKWEGK